MDEFQQAVGLAVFRAVLRDAGKNRLGVIAEHGKLNEIGRVEHCVSGLLVRIDPFFLGVPDLRPLAYALAGGESALIVVAHDAAEQAVVAGRYPVVVVKGRAGERIDEYAELGL